MSRSLVKALTVASVLVTGLAMSAPAFADGGSTTSHFQLTSMSLSTNSVTLGSSFDVTLNASQINQDNQGNENHTHALPAVVDFMYTVNGHNVTLIGHLQTPDNSASNVDAVGSTFTGTYLVNVPSSLSVPSKGVTSNLIAGGFDMAYGLNPPPNYNAFTSPDTDDPVSNSLEGVSLTVSPGGTPAQMPEVPFASALPAALVLGGFGTYLFISRRKAAQR